MKKILFIFLNLISPYDDSQNYFAYKISFENSTCTINNNTTSIIKPLNNTINFSFNESLIIDEVFNSATSTSSHDILIKEKIVTPVNMKLG